MAGAYLLAMWCPVFRWRDSDPGSGTELENSPGNGKGKLYKCENTKGESTDVRGGGGSSGSSDEALVMSVERRG
jgi:hypothetical protein